MLYVRLSNVVLHDVQRVVIGRTGYRPMMHDNFGASRLAALQSLEYLVLTTLA